MALYIGGSSVSKINVGTAVCKEIWIGNTKVWPEGYSPGTVFNFSYTGSVQSIELPQGKYKLQCWGAQGGTSDGSSSGAGSKGGYSEGVLTLTETTTLYVFVGGKGSNGSSTSLVNGGWNGGGASVGYSSYDSSGEYGYSYPACGGGATDICTVTSSMSYSSGRTNRSSASLLSRIIVAGGGAGGSYCYKRVTTTTETKTEENLCELVPYYTTSSQVNVAYEGGAAKHTYELMSNYNTYRVTGTIEQGINKIALNGYFKNSDGSLTYTHSLSITLGTEFTVNWDSRTTSVVFGYIGTELTGDCDLHLYAVVKNSTTTTDSTSEYSNQSQQGGGTSGRGQYPGTQSSAGGGSNAGGFGYGANQTSTNYRYCSGGGGGGWYGGGTHRSDSSTSYINYTGGGSGFVNTSSNASSRPSGYTGLQLDSGTTTAGNTSHPSTSGGTETGHSGNGYAKITVLGGSGGGGSTTASISWTVQTGNWTEGSNSSAKDGKQFTSVSPGSSSSTRLRCTFSGVTSITFNCVYNGESSYDYLTVGNLDSTCTRDSYGTTLKGTSGTAKDITFSCDSGTHYVEFCYSKDGSVDTSPDCAVVYVKSYS